MSAVQPRAMGETVDLEQTSGYDIIVRRPMEFDVAGLAALFSAMHSYHHRPVSDEAAIMAARLACRPPVARFDPRVLIALRGGIVVGSSL